MAYFLVVERTKGQAWAPQFGDFDCEVAQEELNDMRCAARNQGIKGMEWKVLTLRDARKKTAEDAVAAINSKA